MEISSSWKAEVKSIENDNYGFIIYGFDNCRKIIKLTEEDEKKKKKILEPADFLKRWLPTT